MALCLPGDLLLPRLLVKLLPKQDATDGTPAGGAARLSPSGTRAPKAPPVQVRATLWGETGIAWCVQGPVGTYSRSSRGCVVHNKNRRVRVMPGLGLVWLGRV